MVDNERLIPNVDALSRDVELLLLKKKVPLRLPAVDSRFPYLTVAVGTVELGGRDAVTYLVDVQLRTGMPSPLDGLYLPVSAWRSIWFGTTNKRDLEINAIDNLLDLVEAFADDYLKANSLEAHRAYVNHSPPLVDKAVADQINQPTEE